MSLITQIGKNIGKRACNKIIHNAVYKKALQEASPLTMDGLALGDLVHIGNIVGVLVEQTDKYKKMISFVGNPELWFYQYGYDPYLGEKGTSWNISTNATDEFNGEKNCNLIFKEECFAKNSTSNSDEKRFPLFEKCHELGENWYIPAIKELECLLCNPRLIESIKSYLYRMLFPNFDGDKTYTFWTSTDDIDEYSAMTLSWNMKTNNIFLREESKSKQLPFFAIYTLYT